MSIRNFTQQSVQPWKDVFCDQMNCKEMVVDTIVITNAEVDNLTVHDNLQGEAEVNLIHPLTAGGNSYIESGENLQMLDVHGALVAHVKDNIRSFHCACDATDIGGFAHQAHSGVQHLSSGDQSLTLHTSNGTDYDLLMLCSQGGSASDIEVAPTLIHMGSANLNAEITTKITLDTPAIQTPQIINGVLRVDGTGNILANAALSQLSDVILTGLAAQDQLVYDGAQWTNSQVSNTYTALFADFTNIDAITLYQSWYTIVGTVITVSIRCLIDSTAIAGSTFSVTLPLPFSVAQADSNHVSGTCIQNSSPITSGIIFGLIGTTNKAQCNFTAISAAPVEATINFSYLIS